MAALWSRLNPSPGARPPGCADGTSGRAHRDTTPACGARRPDTAPAADRRVLRGCSDAIDQVAPVGPDGTLLPHQPGRNTCVLDWRARVGPDSTLNPRVRGSSPWRRTRAEQSV